MYKILRQKLWGEEKVPKVILASFSLLVVATFTAVVAAVMVLPGLGVPAWAPLQRGWLFQSHPGSAGHMAWYPSLSQ